MTRQQNSEESRTRDKSGQMTDNKITGNPGWEIKAVKRQDDETAADPRREIRVLTETGTRAGTERGDKREEDLGWEDKEDPIRAQSFASCSFFLAARSFFFFTTSFSESMTTWPGLSTTAGLAVNSKSVISVKCGNPSLRYPIADKWKPRTCKVLSAKSSILKLSKSKASVSQSWLKSKRYLLGSMLVRRFQRQLIIILFSFLVAIIRCNVVDASLTTVMTLWKNVSLQWE